TWNDARRGTVGAALAGEPALDDAASARAIGLIDAFAGRWRGVADDACRLNKVTATQSDTAFEARSRCLQRRRAELDLQLARIEHGTSDSIAAAVGGLHSLVEPEVCNDIALLMQTVPPPDDPVQRETLAELEAREHALEQAILLEVSTGIRPEIDALLVDAERLGWAPMMARAHILDAQLREVEGDLDGAEEALYAVALAAGRGHDSEQLIGAWISLTYLVGQLQGRVPEALQLARVSEVEISRNGYPHDTVRLLTSKGAVYQAGNDKVHARESWQRGIDMLDADPQPRTYVRGVLLNNLGTLDLLEGDSRAALERFRGARDIATELFGPAYPPLADNYLNMCLAHTQLGQYADAVVECTRARELLDRPGSEKAALARVLQGLTAPTLASGHIEEAGELAKRARAGLAESYGERSYAVAAAEISLAQVALYSGDPAGAREHAELAKQILGELGPAFANMHGDAELVLGLVAFGAGDLDGALARCSEAVKLAETALGSEHPSLLEALACRGAALAGLRR
ncbi:MAG: hypothetical protein IAG13_19995, partial [Deltaproteobacteria bacterium]|nr:hypothetical protein [Nannocystaceae bacterium]